MGKRSGHSPPTTSISGSTFLVEGLWLMYSGSWEWPLLQCSAIIRWAADPCLLLTEVVISPDNCLIYLWIKSIFLFSIAALYPSQQATLNIHSISICNGLHGILISTDSSRKKSVSWSSVLAIQPSHPFVGCQRDSQMLGSDFQMIWNQFCSASECCDHQAHFLESSALSSWRGVFLSALFRAWKIKFSCLGHSFFMYGLLVAPLPWIHIVIYYDYKASSIRCELDYTFSAQYSDSIRL